MSPLDHEPRIRSLPSFASAEAYRLAVEEALQGVLLFGGGRIVFANPAISRLTGYSREELRALSPEALRELIPAEERAEVLRQLATLRQEPREALCTELRFRRRDGELRWIEVMATPIDYAGQPAELFTFVDITERRKAEESLRENEERFARAFLASPTPALIASLDTGRVVDANEALERVTGYRRTDLLGRSVPELRLFAGPDQVRGMLHTLRGGRGIHGLETSYTQASGEPGVALIYAEPIVLAGETCAIWQGIDVTASRRAEAERRRLAEQVMRARRLEGLGVLAGGVAHDFNNLLVAIRGNAELARLHLGASHPARELVEDLDRAADRAADLVRSLLTYAGVGRADTEPVDLAALVRETLRILRSRLSSRLKVELPTLPDEAWVQGDATQLGQVVMNLVTNASEALEGTEDEISVRVGPVRLGREELDTCLLTGGVEPGPYVLLEVADTGRGMAPDTLERIFDPFYTTKFQGRGLGLAGVLGAVRGHGGTLRVSSRPGEGTTFRIFLPPGEKAAPRADEARPVSQREPRRATVLVVDDEPAVRAVAARMLEARGFTVVAAASGAEALARVERAPDAHDAVLLDLTMPGLGGEETFHALRRVRSDLPVVFMSGHGPEDVALRLAEEARVRHVAKPFRMETLAARLHEVLEEAETLDD